VVLNGFILSILFYASFFPPASWRQCDLDHWTWTHGKKRTYFFWRTLYNVPARDKCSIFPVILFLMLLNIWRAQSWWENNCGNWSGQVLPALFFSSFVIFWHWKLLWNKSTKFIDVLFLIPNCGVFVRVPIPDSRCHLWLASEKMNVQRSLGSPLPHPDLIHKGLVRQLRSYCLQNLSSEAEILCMHSEVAWGVQDSVDFYYYYVWGFSSSRYSKYLIIYIRLLITIFDMSF
jgi:hypothetical protein